MTILGAGTSTGVPVLGCNCLTCTSNDPRNHRTRCSALLQWDERTILIDTATDFRQQALRENIQKIDAVLFTHTHADHIHGIDDLRTYCQVSGDAIPVYAEATAIHRIKNLFDYIFTEGETPGYLPRINIKEVNGPFELFGQFVIPIPLIHGPGHALGFRIGNLAYLTDCNVIPNASKQLLHGLEILVIDALRFRPHNSHFSIPEAIKVAQELGAKQTILTHLSHDVDYSRHIHGLPDCVTFAYDGQTISLPLAMS